MKSGKLLLGALAGIAIGSILGILFAPDKGSATRKRVMKKGEDYAEELGEQFKAYSKEKKEKLATAQEDILERAKNIKSKAEETFAERINTIK